MEKRWLYGVWKSWKAMIYQKCITHDDYMGQANVEFYETVKKINDEGMSVDIAVEPESLRTVVRMKKDRNRYLLPVEYEEKLPVVVAESFPCQVKASDKVVYQYITKINSMSIPAVKNGTFKEFIQSWNPLNHSESLHWEFIKIMSVASKYKSIKCCIASEPSFGKNSNFMVINHILQRVSRLSAPTPAKLYEVIVNNDVIVIDELTSVKSEQVREIEGMVLQLGDNSTEYMKHSMAIGRQLKEADLAKKSLIFTYNRPQDISAKSTYFDDKWNNKNAFQSRYPQLLLKGKVLDDAEVLSPGQVNKVVDANSEWFKEVAKELSYWTQNIHEHLHKWDKSVLKAKGRHLSNLAGLLDALDVYSDTQEEFNTWMEFINTSIDNYKKMVQGQDVQWEQDQKIKVKEVSMNELMKAESELL